MESAANIINPCKPETYWVQLIKPRTVKGMALKAGDCVLLNPNRKVSAEMAQLEGVAVERVAINY